MRNMNSKVELRLTRKISVPQAGPDAYTLKSKSVNFTYGKNGTFKNSKLAVEAAKEKSKLFMGDASEIEIVVWRGSRGDCLPVKKSEDRFILDFEGNPVSF